MKHISMDETERNKLNAQELPYQSEAICLQQKEEYIFDSKEKTISLCGEWEFVSDGWEGERIFQKNWADSFYGEVPCDIHTALYKAGKIPDPMVGLNDNLARQNSYKVWWIRRYFDKPEYTCPEIVFEGVCYDAKIWLNGKYLGNHKGMFGQFSFETGELKDKNNELVVKIENEPTEVVPYSENAFHDEGWKKGTVINCVYGWHYAYIPSRGIWRPVYLRNKRFLECERPFFVAKNPMNGNVDITFRYNDNVNGSMKLMVSPLNFKGEKQYYITTFHLKKLEYGHYIFKINHPRLWWPNNYGEQNLYKIVSEFTTEDGQIQNFEEIFGLRKIEMKPTPIGCDENRYNWQLCINGKDIFIKGTNWCTIDALLRFDEAKYDRLLSLAKKEGINLLRAWGGGMPELNYFYEQCDRLGIMVFQEWPTAWDSHYVQPINELVETAIQHTIRLRNHPSLVIWAGGNESGIASGPNMEKLMQIAYELDGTRAFHRSEPCGQGTVHDYSTYWFKKEIDASLKFDGIFIGEFGMASAPSYSSMLKYVDKNEIAEWNLKKRNSITHHMPRFNECDWPLNQTDESHLSKQVEYFWDKENPRHWIYASQLAQATVLRHPIEKFRTEYPYTTGVCYYKLNDVYPACSWSSIDYYGAPKLAYYIVQDSYASLGAYIIFDSVNQSGNVKLPVYLINDRFLKDDYIVTVCAYNEELKLIKKTEYKSLGGKQVERLGEFCLNSNQTETFPLFITIKILNNDNSIFSTFYWLNYLKKCGCLFNLKKCELKVRKDKNNLYIKTIGVPAVGLQIESDEEESFEIDDNFIWLDEGKEIKLTTNKEKGWIVGAWNAEKVKIK